MDYKWTKVIFFAYFLPVRERDWNYKHMLQGQSRWKESKSLNYSSAHPLLHDMGMSLIGNQIQSRHQWHFLPKKCAAPYFLRHAYSSIQNPCYIIYAHIPKCWLVHKDHFHGSVYPLYHYPIWPSSHKPWFPSTNVQATWEKIRPVKELGMYICPHTHIYIYTYQISLIYTSKNNKATDSRYINIQIRILQINHTPLQKPKTQWSRSRCFSCLPAMDAALRDRVIPL